jgi:hypothetical protein
MFEIKVKKNLNHILNETKNYERNTAQQRNRTAADRVT